MRALGAGTEDSRCGHLLDRLLLDWLLGELVVIVVQWMPQGQVVAIINAPTSKSKVSPSKSIRVHHLWMKGVVTLSTSRAVHVFLFSRH